MSITDNSGNSIYGKGVAPGPDGNLSFQPGNALTNANIRDNSSITGKDSSLY